MMKLYLVTCRDEMKSAGRKHGQAYVVASDPDAAYKVVREYLDIHDYGFDHQRELDTIQLIADENDYPDCGIMLFVAK